jgi:hypothetical protein
MADSQAATPRTPATASDALDNAVPRATPRGAEADAEDGDAADYVPSLPVAPFYADLALFFD